MTELAMVAAPTHSSARRAVFIVTALGAFMASLDLSIVNVAFPALERSFPADTTATLAWVITGYSIVFGSLLVVAGRTADRLSSRTIFMAGLTVFVIGSLACAAAPSVGFLICGRLVQGVGAAALLPSSLGILLATYPAERRSQIVALWGGVGALAVATGPSLGAALISAWGWRSAFYVNVPVGILAGFLGVKVLTHTPRRTDGRLPDLTGAAILAVTVGALVFAITEGSSWGWSDAPVLGAITAAVVLGALFIRRSMHHLEPVLDLGLFRARSFAVANAATFVYAMGFFAMLLGNILFLTGVWHYSILRAGLSITPGPLVVAVVSGPAGRAAGRLGFRPVLLTGFVTFAAGLAWYVLRVGVQPDYLGVWLPGSLVTGAGIGLTFPVQSAAAVSSLRPDRYSVGSAVNQTARQVGGSLGVAVLVVIVGAPATAAIGLDRFRHLWLFVASMAVLAGAISARHVSGATHRATRTRMNEMEAA